MANKTIGGDINPLESIGTIVPDQDLLAIWDKDAGYTKSTTPEKLINTVVKDDIDTIKKDLGGQPYIPFSTYWKILEQGDSGFQSIYDNNSSDYYPTYAEKQIQKIETNLKQVNKDLNNNNAWPQYDTTGASSYMNNALDWLGSLQGRVDTLKSNLKGDGTWPSETGASSYVNNALTWLQSLQARDDDLGNNYLKKWWNRYWADQDTSHGSFNYKNYEKNPSGSGAQDTPPTIKNKDRLYYYFALQNDGNLVLYRATKTQGDNPSNIGNNRQWVWQTGPEYKPAIFRIIADFYIGKDSMSNTPKSFELSEAINRRNEGDWESDGKIKVTIPSYFTTEGSSDYTILGVKNKGFYNLPNGSNATVNSLNINYLTNKIDTTITKAQTDDNQVYLKLQIILCRDSNIPDPENYPNTDLI